MFIAEEFLLKLESCRPPQVVNQTDNTLVVNQYHKLLQTRNQMGVSVILSVDTSRSYVIVFDLQNTSQQQVGRQSSQEKYGAINEDFWIDFDPVYFSQDISYH